MAFFNLKVMTDFFKRIGEYDEDKAKKIIHKYLTNDDLGRMLFDPPEDQLKEINDQTEQLISQMIKKKSMNAIIESLDEYGYSGYPRWTPVFLNTIVENAGAVAVEGVKQLDTSLENGSISKSDARDRKETFEKIYKRAEQLDKRISKMCKQDAKKLSAASDIDKDVCKLVLRTCPELSKDSKESRKGRPLISRNRLKVWLPMQLNILYSNADKFADDVKDVNWKNFFKFTLGADNLPDVATILLVEGVDRIKDIDSANVRKVWDSLTAFALNTLEYSENGTRSKMIEMYIKRVTNMFQNGTKELRVDLTTLSSKDFPNLTKTISAYAEKLKEAFGVKEND